MLRISTLVRRATIIAAITVITATSTETAKADTIVLNNDDVKVEADGCAVKIKVYGVEGYARFKTKNDVRSIRANIHGGRVYVEAKFAKDGKKITDDEKPKRTYELIRGSAIEKSRRKKGHKKYHTFSVIVTDSKGHEYHIEAGRKGESISPDGRVWLHRR